MTTIDHPWLNIDTKYLYKGYRYNISFVKNKSRWNYAKERYEPKHDYYQISAVFSHATPRYYMFINPKVAVLKKDLIEFNCIDYEGGV